MFNKVEFKDEFISKLVEVFKNIENNNGEKMFSNVVFSRANNTLILKPSVIVTEQDVKNIYSQYGHEIMKNAIPNYDTLYVYSLKRGPNGFILEIGA